MLTINILKQKEKAMGKKKISYVLGIENCNQAQRDYFKMVVVPELALVLNQHRAIIEILEGLEDEE